MRTSLAYAISMGMHGAAFGMLAYAATAYPELITIQFAVREGDANGAVSQPRWARRIEATFDTQVAPAATALAVTVPAPVTSPPMTLSVPPMPEPSPELLPPREPPTVANRDDALILNDPFAKPMIACTGRGPGPLAPTASTELPREVRSDVVAARTPPTAVETQLDSVPSALIEIPEIVPERIATAATNPTQPGLASSAASVTVQPLEPGNDDFDAIAANSPQGARVSQLPSRLPRNREPVYPEELRRQGIGGTVMLRVTIAADGTAQDVTLAKSSGYLAFDESALTAVRNWRFEPARRNDIAVKYTVKLPITFSVRK